MKQPWEVYYESFAERARKLPFDKLPWTKDAPETEAFYQAARTARESIVYHMVEALHWRPTAAGELADKLLSATIKWLPTSGSGDWAALREALRHAWTDYQLQEK